MSAAAAGCWELRLQQELLPGERRVLRWFAERDGNLGTSADDEVAVVGNSRSECRTVRGTNAEPGPSACCGDVTTLSSVERLESRL